MLWVLTSHFVASGVTTTNRFQYGCVFSLILLPLVMLTTAYAFWAGVSKIYMPQPHSNTRLSLPASFSYGSRAEAEMNNEPIDQDDDMDNDHIIANRSVTGEVGYDARRYHED